MPQLTRTTWQPQRSDSSFVMAAPSQSGAPKMLRTSAACSLWWNHCELLPLPLATAFGMRVPLIHMASPPRLCWGLRARLRLVLLRALSYVCAFVVCAEAKRAPKPRSSIPPSGRARSNNERVDVSFEPVATRSSFNPEGKPLKRWEIVQLQVILPRSMASGYMYQNLWQEPS